MKKVITISRQFSSGGREVGKRLADALNIAYYDKELIARIAKETNLHPDYIATFQDASVSRNYNFIYGRSFYAPQPIYNANDEIMIAQKNIITQIASEQDCVIVGRCADYFLSDIAFKVFVYSSDMQMRIKRCIEKVPEDANKAEKELTKEILNIDKNRQRYYSFYTGKEWKNLDNYDLCVNTAALGINKSVQAIMAAL